jgi:EmrB/QacA subfamily drug resistance transporter
MQQNCSQTSGSAATSTPWVLACLSLATLMSSLNTSIANVGLPTLARSFGAPFQQVQWIVLAYLLAVSTLIVAVGRLSDIMGRRRVLLSGLYLFTSASILCGAAPTLGILIAARVVQGLGAASMMAVPVALVGETVPKDKTGRAMGLLGTMSALGTTLGPSLGGVLIAGFGWRATFLANLPLGILSLYLTHRHMPPSHSDRKSVPARVDMFGTALLGLTLAAYALSMTTGRGRFGSQNLALLVAAVLGATLFVIVEARTASPLVDLRIFRNPALRASLATSAMVSTVMMSTLVVGPFYLSRALGLQAVAVGLVMSAGPLVAALAGVPSGRMVDRFGAMRMTIAGLVVMPAGCLALCFAPALAGAFGYIGAIVVVTAGYALFQAANTTAAMAEIGPDQRGVVSGMLNLSRNLGLVTGASAMAALFALASAAADPATAPSQAVARGMQITFLAAAMISMTALAAVLGKVRLWRKGGRQDPPEARFSAQRAGAQLPEMAARDEARFRSTA